MKRFLIAAIVLIAAGYMFVRSIFTPTPKAQALAVGVTVVYTQLPTDTPMPTMTPYPTIDYRATDQAYQLQMEAQRNDMIKAQLAHDEEMLRQQVELARINATATAAGTQMVMVNDANTLQAGQLTAESNRITATAQLPTQIVAMNNSIRTVQNSKRDDTIYVIGVSVVMFVLICFGIFMASFPKLEMKRLQYKMLELQNSATDEYPEPARETVVNMRQDRGGGDFGQKRFIVPCTPEQFTELATGLTQGKKTLAINQWEGKGTLFTRPVIAQVRGWARMNNFAVATADGQLAPTNEFLTFLIGWLAQKQLQEGYGFVESTPTPPAG